jgi:hypothetical protein
LLDVAVTLKAWTSTAGPALMPLKLMVCGPESSKIAGGSAITASVGASFTAATVTTNVRLTASTPPLVVPPLSRSTTVIVAVPFALATGVSVRVPVACGLV